MTNCLSILGLVCVFGCLLFGLLALRIFLRLRAAARRFGGAAEHPPARIHLKAVDSVHWRDAKAYAARAKEMEEAGFQGIALYEIAEMPGTYLAGWRHATEPVVGAILDNPQAGLVTDLVVRFEDESGLTFSSIGDFGRVDAPPHSERSYDSNATVSQLLERALARVRESGKTPRMPEDFARYFELSYARDMDWRAARGGATMDEIRRVAKATLKTDIPEDQLLEAKRREEEKNLVLLDACLRANAEEAELGGPAFDPSAAGVFVVHDRLTEEAFSSLLVDADLSGDEVTNCLARMQPGTAPRERFRAIAALSLPEGQPLRFLFTVGKPIEADFWFKKIDIA